MREITENDVEMFATMLKLRHLSKCIDKQVVCIIVDDFNNILSIGVNTIEACDQNCADKEKRVCVVRHAEVVAVDNLSTLNRQRARRAYVSLFPCAACQHVLAPYVDEIVTFGMAHKKWESEKVIVFPHLVYKNLTVGSLFESTEQTVTAPLQELYEAIEQEKAHKNDAHTFERLRKDRAALIRHLLTKYAGRVTCKTLQDKAIGDI